MNIYVDKSQKNKSQSVVNSEAQRQSSGESTFQFVDNRPEAVVQRKLQEMANNGPRTMQLKASQNWDNEVIQPVLRNGGISSADLATWLSGNVDEIMSRRPDQLSTGTGETMRVGWRMIAWIRGFGYTIVVDFHIGDAKLGSVWVPGQTGVEIKPENNPVRQDLQEFMESYLSQEIRDHRDRRGSNLANALRGTK